MAEKPGEVAAKVDLPAQSSLRADETTKPATEFQYMAVDKKTRKVLKKGQVPLVKSNSAGACMGKQKPQQKKMRHSSHSGSVKPVPFMSPGGEDLAVGLDGSGGLGHSNREQPNEEVLWNELQTLIARFESMEADFIQKFQDKLSDLRGAWEQKLREITDQDVEDTERDKDSAQLELSTTTITDSSEASLLNSEVQDLRVRLSQKEKECWLLKKELESKESQLREVKQNLSEKEMTEANLNGVASVLDLCATLKRKDHRRSEQDSIKTRIITTMKHIQRLKLGQLWQAWTI